MLNAENGDSARAGTNVEYELLVVDGQVKLKAEVPNDLSIATLLPEVDCLSYSASEREWLVAIIKELHTIETVQSVHERNHSLLSDKSRTKLAFLSFPLGFQGKEYAADYEAGQALAVGTASILFRSLFGTQQSEFASVLLHAIQFRGSEWTTATFIGKGTHNGVECSHSYGCNRTDQQRYCAHTQ